MGEYINHKAFGETKIGTCENLYYTTHEAFTKAYKAGMITPAEFNDYTQVDTFRFRFPFPDEDKIKIGQHEDFDRGELFRVPKSIGIEIGHTDQYIKIENKAGNVGFTVPCMRSDNFPHKLNDWPEEKSFVSFEIVQQKLVTCEAGGVDLATIVRCPYCGNLCRLDAMEALKLHIYADEKGDYYNQRQKEIIRRVLAGYKEHALVAK